MLLVLPKGVSVGTDTIPLFVVHSNLQAKRCEKNVNVCIITMQFPFFPAVHHINYHVFVYNISDLLR